MSALIDCEDHLLFHILEIRPEDIKGNIVLVVLAHYFTDHWEGFVAPTALMMSKTPEGRNGWTSTVQIDTLHCSLWVLLSEEEPEIEDSSNHFEDKIALAVFVGLDDVHGFGAVKIVDVEEVVPPLEDVVGEVAVGT